MEKEKKSKIWNIVKKILYVVFIAIIVLIIIDKFSRNRVSFDSASNLIKIDEVEKFNLAKFKWNGIAKYYKKDSNKVNTFIKYEAEIVATMNMEEFSEKDIVINQKEKKIYITLPKIELIPTVVFKENGESFSFIPSSTKIEMKDIITTCENDAKEKVQERVKLLDIAKENAKSTIEGLILPMVEDNNYTIVWKDGE